MYGQVLGPSKDNPRVSSITSPITEVYTTPATSAGWLASTTSHISTVASTGGAPAPIQSIPGEQGTQEPGSVIDSAIPQAASTGPQDTTGPVSSAPEQVSTTTSVAINSQSTATQVNTFISPTQMVYNMRPPNTSISSYAPTWSTIAPHMSATQVPQVPPSAQAGYAAELSAIRQQLARLEGVVGTQPYTHGATHTTGAAWAQPSVDAHVTPAASPAIAGPATGAGWQPITSYAQLAFHRPQGAGTIMAVPNQAQHVQVPQHLNSAASVYERAVAPATHMQEVPQLQPSMVPGLKNPADLGDLNRYAPFPGMQDRVLKAALTGMYVSLDDFLFSTHCNNLNEGQLVMDAATNQLTYKPNTATRKVHNFSTWLEAYLNYMKLMINVNGLPMYYAMNDYINFVQQNEARFYWYAVESFDVNHRQWLSGKTMNMSNIDPIIVAANLPSSAAKHEVRCTHCKSPEHTSHECPSAGAVPPSGRRNRSSSRGKRQDEICKKYNAKGCTFQGCKRAHKCIMCRGDLPVKQCVIRGPCAEENNERT